MGQLNESSGSLGLLPGNPTLFGFIIRDGKTGSTLLSFDLTTEEIGHYYGRVKSSYIGFPLVLRDSGFDMRLQPTGVTIEGDVIRMVYMYGDPGSISEVLVTIGPEEITGSILHVSASSN